MGQYLIPNTMRISMPRFKLNRFVCVGGIFSSPIWC